MVDNSGEGAVGKVEQASKSSGLRCKYKGVGYAGVKDTNSYYVLFQRRGPKLLCAFLPNDVADIDNSVGGNQYVLIAVRENEQNK